MSEQLDMFAHRCVCSPGAMCQACGAWIAMILRHQAAAGAALVAKWSHGSGSPEHLDARAAADVTRAELATTAMPKGRFG